MDHLAAAAEQFSPQSQVLDVREYGSGNVHDTFLVTLDSAAEKRFILQRLNTRVFRRPELILRNLSTCTGHMLRRLELHPLSPARRWEVPRVLLTRNAQDHWIDPAGSFWRALSFIDAAETFDTIKDLEHAKEIGYALGLFHQLLSNLPPERLADTLPGFHVTPLYLRHYDEVLAKTDARRVSLRGGRGNPLRKSPPALPSKTILPSSPEVDYALRFVDERRAFAPVLEQARAQERLALRVIHGDPKVNNVMLDVATGKAVSLIDLDTVKPGLVHYDIGDCLRSGCNPLGEETERWEAVRFEPDLCRALLQGYLSQARDFLTESDYEYLYDAIRLLAFELGLRFFTDYLEGNVYFKAGRREHNLARALVQFKLTESIEAQEPAIRAIIRDEIFGG